MLESGKTLEIKRLKVVKILAALSILNSGGASPGATKKVAALVAIVTAPRITIRRTQRGEEFCTHLIN